MITLDLEGQSRIARCGKPLIPKDVLGRGISLLRVRVFKLSERFDGIEVTGLEKYRVGSVKEDRLLTLI